MDRLPIKGLDALSVKISYFINNFVGHCLRLVLGRVEVLPELQRTTVKNGHTREATPAPIPHVDGTDDRYRYDRLTALEGKVANADFGRLDLAAT